jgi:hypothetical protein
VDCIVVTKKMIVDGMMKKRKEKQRLRAVYILLEPQLLHSGRPRRIPMPLERFKRDARRWRLLH